MNFKACPRSPEALLKCISRELASTFLSLQILSSLGFVQLGRRMQVRDSTRLLSSSTVF